MELLRMRATGALADLPSALDFRAVEIRKFGWTNLANIDSLTLSNTLANTPVGGVSRVIEDANGFHIIRVLERVDQSAVPRQIRSGGI